MKRFLHFVCLLVTIGTLSCSNSEELLTQNKDVNSTSISRAPKSDDDNNKSDDEKKQDEEEKQKQDQEKLKEYTVYVDALHAAVGTALSGGNIGVGLVEGMVASLDFYLGGSLNKDMLKEDTYKNNPFIINPSHPVIINGIDLKYPLDTEYEIVGQGHNAIIREMYANGSFGTATEYELFEKAYYMAADMYPKYFDEKTDIASLYNEIQQSGDIKEEEKKHLEDISDQLFYVPIEYTQKILKELVEKDTTSTKCYSACLSTAYASRCLWNTIAPDPHIAQEGLLYDIHSNSLHYLSSREEVYDALYSNTKDILLFFPCYMNDKLMALYLYDGHYGVKPNTESIPEVIYLSDNVVFETKSDLTVTIETGKYAIKPTIFDDTYYIYLQ